MHSKRRMEKMIKIVRVRVMRQVLDKVQGISERVGKLREKALRMVIICQT